MLLLSQHKLLSQNEYREWECMKKGGKFELAVPEENFLAQDICGNMPPDVQDDNKGVSLVTYSFVFTLSASCSKVCVETCLFLK